MNNPAAAAETIFAEAIRQPCGRVRDEFVRDRCRSDPALQQEVESLLAAHERAGSFLETHPGMDGGTTGQSTAFMNAAAQAEHFLRAARNGEEELDRFIAQLPGHIREETRERINAALRVRKIHRDRGIASLPAEATPPQFPGFRIEHKLGEGSLGIVYAAHDEKLNRRVAIKVLRPHAQRTGPPPGYPGSAPHRRGQPSRRS